jgi:hypothetical protein
MLSRPLKTLRCKQNRIRSKLQDLKTTGDDAWDDLKTDEENVWSGFKAASKELTKGSNKENAEHIGLAISLRVNRKGGDKLQLLWVFS